MANKKSDIFELRFEGNGIKPNKVKSSEVGALLQEFEKVLLSVIKQDYPQVDTNELVISFDKIEDRSLGLSFAPHAETDLGIRRIVSKSYNSLTAAIETGSYSKYGNETVRSLRTILDFTKKYGCSGSFNHNGKKLTTITPNTQINYLPSQYLKGNATIYGELIDAGGDRPNIHIKIADSYSVVIKTDKQQTKDLAARLYEQVGLKGEAKWDALTSKIEEFKLYEVLDYKAGNLKNAMNELRKETSGVWDNFNSNEAINQKLLR